MGLKVVGHWARRDAKFLCITAVQCSAVCNKVAMRHIFAPSCPHAHDRTRRKGEKAEVFPICSQVPSPPFSRAFLFGWGAMPANA